MANAEIAQTRTNITIPNIQSKTLTKVGIQVLLLLLVSSLGTSKVVGSNLISGSSFVYCPHNTNRISYSSPILQILRLTIFS